MFRLGLFTSLVGILQPAIAAYAFQLNRVFGPRRVGWFVFAAFTFLALLHALVPFRPGGLPTGGANDIVQMIVLVLVFFGLAHAHAFLRERTRLERQAATFKTGLESNSREKADLDDTREGLLNEIAARAQREKILEHAIEQYRSLFTEHPQPMCLFDVRTLRFLEVNQAAIRHYGFSAEEFLCMTVRQLCPAETVSALLEHRAPAGSPTAAKTWQLRRKDGTLAEVEITALDLTYGGAAARLFLTADVSQRRQLDWQREQLLKREAKCQVAGDIAGHFTGLLSVIEGNTELLRRRHTEPDSAAPLAEISEAVSRASGLARNLLVCGGRQETQLAPLHLNQLLQQLAPTIDRFLGKAIFFETSLISNLRPVLANATLIEHAVLNLVLNARDAMAPGGTLTLTTTATWIDHAYCQRHPDARPGQFACLTVADTGAGMTPEAQARLFEPFFTTRPQAAGLGLATVYGTVKQHSGWVEISTEPGAGTEVKLFLPFAPESEVAAAPAPAQSAAASAARTVLLVERNDRLRELARATLSRQGFRIIEADSPDTALVLWASRNTNVDLVLTNVAFPGRLSGCELAERLRESRPDLKVLYTADAPADPSDPLIIEGRPPISIPFTPETLLRSVKDFLAAVE